MIERQKKTKNKKNDLTVRFFSCFSLIYYRKEKMINIKSNFMKKNIKF